MSSRRDVVRVAALVLAYATLAVWLTWPLAARMATHLPCTWDPVCRYDTVYSAWVASWVSHALLTAPWHVGDANIYYPTPQALYYGPAGFGVAAFALPVFAATGNAALAINLAFLSCVTLTAVALHWVVWRWTGDMPAGFVAAWTLLMNHWFLWGFIPTTPHLVALQYIPLIAFLAAKQLGTWRPALALLALVVVQCLTDPVYVAPAVLLPLGVLALARVVRREWRASGWRLAAVLGATTLCLVPLFLGYVSVRLRNPALAKQTLWKVATRLNVQSVSAVDLRRLLWTAQPPGHPGPLSVGIAVVCLIAVGGGAGAVRWWRGGGSGLGRYWAQAALWAVVGIVIALPPVVSLTYPATDGTWARARISLPQSLLSAHGSLYQVVRVPARLGVAGMIGICLLSGLALAELGRALTVLGARGRWSVVVRMALAAAAALLVYFNPPSEAVPMRSRYPLQSAPDTNAGVMRLLQQGDGPVLELPVMASNPNGRRPHWMPAPNAAAMYRSTLHWRPLVNGYSSYWPAGFPERIERTLELPNRAALEDLVCNTGVRTIVVNLNYYSRQRRAAWLLAGRNGADGLRLIGRHLGLLVFTVTVPLPGQPGSPECRPSV